MLAFGAVPSATCAGIKPSSAPMFIVMQPTGAVTAYGLIRYLYPTPTRKDGD